MKHWLLLIFCSPLLSYAQITVSYSDTMTIGKVHGNVIRNYLVQGEDSVLSGKFEFKSTDLNEVLNKDGKFYYVSGFFQDNQPDGFWNFHFGNYETGSDYRVKDQRLNISLTGVQQRMTGIMSGGDPEGDWVLTVQHLKNSEAVKTPFSSNFNFKDGIPQASFQIENEYITLLGRVLRGGLAHDQWELVDKNTANSIEQWVFADGKLGKIFVQNDTISYTIDFQNYHLHNPIRIDLDTRYLNWLQLYCRLNHPEAPISESGIYQLLNENAVYYDQVDQLLQDFSTASIGPAIGVVASHDPLSTQEKALLDSIHSLISTAQMQYVDLDNDPQMQIMKLATKEVSNLFDVLDQINETYLMPLHELINYYNADVLDLVDRSQVVDMLGLAQPSTDSGLADSSTITANGVPIKDSIDESKLELATAYHAAWFSYDRIDSIAKELGRLASIRKKERELADLEKEIISKQKALKELADSLSVGTSGQEADAILQISANADRMLQEYSNRQNNDSIIVQAKNLISCLEQSNDLMMVVALQPGQWSQIEEAYFNQVWNPFTITVMDEQIKPRILAAYQQVLMPYLYDRIIDGFQCDETSELFFLFESINSRMLELVHEETGKLERKLRRADQPDEVLDLFKIDI